MDIETITDSKAAPTIQVYYLHFSFEPKRENEIMEHLYTPPK